MKTAPVLAFFLSLAAAPLRADSQREPLSSLTNSRLLRVLEEHAEFDRDADGILSFAEFQAAVKENKWKREEPRSRLLRSGELLIEDFEDDFGKLRQRGWKFEGSAFANSLNEGTKRMRRRAGWFSGRYLLSSFATGTDAAIGLATSPEFLIEFGLIEFLLSGGEHPGRIGVELVVGGEVVRAASGVSDDRMERVAFDVAALIGATARLRVRDAHSGLWGHINVDRIVQTDSRHYDRLVDSPPKVEVGASELLTVDGSKRGVVTIENGALLVSGEMLPLERLLLVSHERPSESKKDQSAVRTVAGELWFVEILGLDKGAVTLQSPLFKKQTLPLSQIASLEFVPGAASAESESGSLERTNGEPIPGKLVWIRKKDIAIDCALGVVPIPRETVTRFVVSKPKPSSSAPGDEIQLRDGSILRGTLTLEGGGFVLKHTALGDLTLAWSDITRIRRTPDGVAWLDRESFKSVSSVGPVLPPEASFVGPETRRVFRVFPHSVLQIALDPRLSKGELRALVAPVPGSRVGVDLKLRSGSQVYFSRRIEAASAEVPIAVSVDSDKPLVLEVDFGERLSFPCGLELRNGHLVSQPRDK
ncbi:MAG: hypothetical protein AAF517_23270 [Planctomycetota bacterium]